MLTHDVGPRSVDALRWLARIWGTLAILLTVPFFVEHLAWFADSSRLPPVHIFVQQGFHLLLLVSLLIAWRWELSGGVLAVLGGIGFFIAAGSGSRLIPIVSTIATPGVLFIACALLSHRGAQTRTAS